MQKAGIPRLLSFRKNKGSKNMSKTWVFIGGMVAGITGVFAAAFAAEEFDARKQNSVLPQQQLELPEGRETKS